MEQQIEPLVVGVRFSKVGKVYHFVADSVTDIKVGDQVVVETTRGWQLGQVAQIVAEPEPPSEGWKAIDRRATPRDLLLRQMWQMKEAEVVSSCRDRATNLNLAGIKIVSAEYSFDGSRLTIFFSSETEEKYDLKSLRSDMQKMFAPSQVEMRQVGPRDVAKTMCGMGACGLETRCCCLFLTEFSSISIRMAKEQGISLTPTEITGMCGRLRCCLIYEYDNYVDARSKLPKRNKRVRTPEGDGKVVDVIPLRDSVVVDLPEVGRKEFKGDEVQILDAEGRPIGKPAPVPPLEGTEQASVMDQTITGDEQKEPFVISPDAPPPDSAWENPPPVEKPRSKPRPERSRRPRKSGPEAGGNRGNEPANRPGAEGAADNQPKDAPAGNAPRRSRGRSGQQGKGQRRESRPPRPAEPGSPEGNQPKPKNEGEGSTSPKSNRDQRRRKGRRRDSSDTENRS